MFLFLKPAREALKVLNSTAAKQMLIYNVTPDGKGFDNSVHTNFSNELEQMGLPAKTQNVAVTNGSLQDVNLFAPGSPIIACNEKLGLNFGQELLNIFIASELGLMLMGETNYAGVFLLNVIPGKTQLSIDFNVNGISSDANANIYSGSIRFHKKIFWLINSSVEITNSSLKKQSGMLAIDGCAGGSEPIRSSDVPDIIKDYIIADRFCFIPRESSLGMNLKDGYTTRNVTGVDLFESNETDFEHFSGPTYYSETHTTFSANTTFLINQLKDKAVYVNQYNPLWCGNQTVLLNNPLNRTLVWSATNNAATISFPSNFSALMNSGISNGILSVSSENYYPLKRRIYNSCNISISGPSTLCSQGTYTVDNLPPGAVVQWSIPYSGAPYPQLSQNVPEVNQATITNPNNYPINMTLTANIYMGGNLITTLTKLVAVQSNSTTQYGSYYQQGCIVNNVTLRALSGSINGNYFYLNQGCLAEITLYDMTNKSVSFNSGYPPSYWSYDATNSKLLVRPAVGSSGVPTTFKITGGCTDKTVQFFTYSLNEGRLSPAFELSPNPATSTVTVEMEEETPLNNSAVRMSTDTKTGSINYTIQLWNSSGLLKQVETDQTSYQLDLTGVPPGFYYVHVIKDGQTYRRQLVVQ